MHYRYGRIIITSIAAVTLSGCTSTLRHTNLLVFGTNTTGGLEVGTNTNQIPRILFGYTRQELVLMPLLANTRAQSSQGGGGKLIPCGLEPSTTANNQSPIQVVPEGCKFLGRSGGPNGDYDTYSVLASFGAGVQAGTTGGKSSASGKVAQYFATGLAARALAENGGAAVIATGNPEAAGGILSEQLDYATQVAVNLAGAAVVTDGNLLAQLAKLDTAAKSGTRFVDACSGLTKQACVDEIRKFRNPGLVTMQASAWPLAANYVFQ